MSAYLDKPLRTWQEVMEIRRQQGSVFDRTPIGERLNIAGGPDQFGFDDAMEEDNDSEAN